MEENKPKKLSAKVILASMKKAPVNRAMNLTDPELHILPKYSEFFAEIDNPELDFTEEEKIRLRELQDEIAIMDDPDLIMRNDKIRVYFILRLQEILYRRPQL